MKAIAFKSGDEFRIELISETPEEREQLMKHWQAEALAVSCEEWREITANDASQD